MRKGFYLLALTIASALSVVSCSEGDIGQSLNTNTIEIVKDSLFTVTGQSVRYEKIRSRTMNQLLGIVKADKYGTLRSDFVTQFMPPMEIDSVIADELQIDSLRLQMQIQIDGSGFFGDSIVPMRADVYRLNKALPFPAYSDLNPSDYYDEKDLLGTASYTATALSSSDSIKKLKYREVAVKLPVQLARDIFREYRDHPSTFSSPTEFAKFFPGVYVKSSFGSGRIMTFTTTGMTFFYRYTEKTAAGRDTTYYVNASYLGAAPEVITNNIIRLDVAPEIKSMVANGDIILQGPVGYNAQIRFPLDQIVDRFIAAVNNSMPVFNSLTFEIPFETINSKDGVKPPQYLLLIQTSELEEFFASNQLPDDTDSFILSNNGKAYVSNDMRLCPMQYIDRFISEGTLVSEEECQYTIVPVSVKESVSPTTGLPIVLSVTPYVGSPAIVKLNLDKSKIRSVYSRKIYR